MVFCFLCFCLDSLSESRLCFFFLCFFSSFLVDSIIASVGIEKKIVLHKNRVTKMLRIRSLRRLNQLLPQKSPQEAVTSILHHSPVDPQPSNRHVLSCLVSDEPGVLSRLSGVLAGRGFNIDSLVVAKTETPTLSRVTIVGLF